MNFEAPSFEKDVLLLPSHFDPFQAYLKRVQVKMDGQSPKPRRVLCFSNPQWFPHLAIGAVNRDRRHTSARPHSPYKIPERGFEAVPNDREKW